MKDYKGAIENYNKAISIKHDISLYHSRANAELLSGDYKSSVDDYTTELTLFTENKSFKNETFRAFIFRGRGEAKASGGDYEGAISDYNSSIIINPELKEAFNNRGDAKRHLGDTMGACADWNQAVNLGYKPAMDHINKYWK
jgi:tetratricopeptide (TPR) repeat protein